MINTKVNTAIITGAALAAVLICSVVVTGSAFALSIIYERDQQEQLTQSSTDPYSAADFTTTDGTSVPYRLYPTENPRGVLLWLHGDGALEWDNPASTDYLGGAQGIIETAKRKHLTLIVPITPDDSMTWWVEGYREADYLSELMNSVSRGSTGTVWLAGFSGGAEQIGYWLIDRLPEMKITSGGAVMFSGGGSPAYEGITDSVPKSTHVAGTFPLRWIVGGNDDGTDSDDGFDALTTAAQGEAFYRSQGWDTRLDTVAGQSHILSLDGVGLYGRYLGQIIPDN